MASEREQRRQAYLDKTRSEVASLMERGVSVGGNAFSPVLLAKGELTAEEAAGAEPFSGADGAALKASLKALGYAPEDWETLVAVGADGESLAPDLMRLAVATLDPATLICCDETATQAVRDAYAEELSGLEDLNEALLPAGMVAHVCGMRFLNLGGFAAALSDPRQKQVMWARLKQVPPLAEPY